MTATEHGARGEAHGEARNEPHDAARKEAGTEEQREAAKLEFFTPAGELIGLTARYEPELRLPARGPVTARHAVLGEGWPVIQYRLPYSARKDQQAREGLEREAGAALAVERAYGEERFAGLFTRFAGHNLDASEPFVLYAATQAPGAEPLSRGAGGFSVEQLRVIMAQLVLVARLLENAGHVHRALTPQNVWWDGKKIRVTEPFAAIPAGASREPYGQPPWAAPEQLAGKGEADPRDDLWSVAQLTYFLVSGRPAEGGGPPSDLGSYRQLSVLRDSGVFDPRADRRPHASEVLGLLNRSDPLAGGSAAAGPLDAYRDEFERLLAAKRRDLVPEPGGEGGTAEEPLLVSRTGWSILRGLAARKADDPQPADRTGGDPEVVCPYCLDPVSYDPALLHTRNERQEYRPLDLSGETNRVRIDDRLRSAFQRCPHSGGMEPHYLPVPYLRSGPPLTIAMVGSSSAGKTHLLGSMIGEVERGGLEPYGLNCRPLNPEWHSRFVRERVQPLHDGQVLARTTMAKKLAFFADGLLVSGHGVTRPVMFFDLAGEDLVEHGEVTRFLAGVSALIFVVDPLRALRIPYLDHERGNAKVPERSLGDESFTTVLTRMPRSGRDERYIDVPAAVAVGKSDLIRFERPVDGWLRQGLPERLTEGDLRAESRDLYAFVRRHGSKAWLRPFAECARCTGHFVSATGGRQQDNVFPNGVRPRRVLAPLLSIFAMSGLLPDHNLNEAGT